MTEHGVELTKNEARSRYELAMGGRVVSLATYYERKGVVVIPHTETLPEMQGRGLAGTLVKFALDDIAAAGRQVDPACPFVEDYIRLHSEYEALRAP
jgi:predicted GNAT family acetyltransferase